jgi:hypothetical protein
MALSRGFGRDNPDRNRINAWDDHECGVQRGRCGDLVAGVPGAAHTRLKHELVGDVKCAFRAIGVML